MRLSLHQTAVLVPAIALGLTVSPSLLYAQEQGAPQGGGGAGGGGAAPTTTTPGPSPDPGRGRQPQQPTFPDPTRDPQQRFPEMQRPMFLSGKVVMEDGTPPPEPVVIERVCNGQPRPEGYTDSKGRFSFQLGQNQFMMADASVSNTGGPGFGNDPGLGGASRSRDPMGGINPRDLMGCEIRASLPGHQSTIVQLSGRRIMDNPDVGTMILRRLGNVEGFTFSMTSAMAPKSAQKAFEKGRNEAKKSKWDNAQKELQKAVGEYPKYAEAWHMLGVVQMEQKDTEAAKQSFKKSLEADDKFVKPYLPLAQFAAGENDWKTVSEFSQRLIRLNPVDFPQAYFYNAVAHYNLQNFDEAEKNAREAVERDKRHVMPKAAHLLGILLAMRHDYNGAAQHMRSYIAHAPQAGDIPQVKQQLAEIEKNLSPAPQPE
jgi:tetratricopeptide (TPR) repeat protein